MKILITGGLGNIGGSIFDVLCSTEHKLEKESLELFIYDNFSYERGQSELLESYRKHFNVTFIPDNIANINSLPDVLRNDLKDLDFVIHLASLTQHPFADIENQNFIETGTKELFRFISEECKNIKKIINLSTTSVYGNVSNGKEPYSEMVKPVPEESLHSYTKYKLGTELTANSYIENHKLPIVSLRMSTNFGYSTGVRLNLFINDWVRNLIGNRPLVSPGTGADWRPFVHTIDAARVMVNILERFDEIPNQTINIGHHDMNLKLNDIYNIVIESAGEFGIVHTDGIEFLAENDENALIESYRVDFSKCQELFNFDTFRKFDLHSGCRDLFKRIIFGN